MSSNVKDSIFSKSGKSEVETHEAHGGTHEVYIEAPASQKPPFRPFEKTFSPEIAGTGNTHELSKERIDDEANSYPKPENPPVFKE